MKLKKKKNTHASDASIIRRKKRKKKMNVFCMLKEHYKGIFVKNRAKKKKGKQGYFREKVVGLWCT